MVAYTRITEIIMPITNLSVNHAEDEILELSTKPREDWLFTFRPLGTINYRDSNSMDAIELISQFNRYELFLLREAKNKVNKQKENLEKARQDEREKIIKVIEKLRNKQEDMRYAYSSDSWEHGISTGVHLALEEIKSPSGDLLRSGVEK